MIASVDPREPRSTTVRVRGHSFHFLEVGKRDAPPVLAIHGLAASSHIYAPLFERASDRFHFYAVDLPSSGKSGSYASVNPTKLADDFAALLHDLGVGPALVIGHSYGGLIALELLARHPRMVTGLLLASPPALGIASLKKWITLSVTERVWSRLGRMKVPPQAIRAYLRFMWGDSKAVTPELVQGYVEAVAADGFYEGQLEALKQVATYQFPIEAIQRSKVPRELLWGERDRLIPVTYGEQVARALGVPMTLIPKCGHFIPQEHPDVLASALAHLAKRARASAPTKKRSVSRTRS